MIHPYIERWGPPRLIIDYRSYATFLPSYITVLSNLSCHNAQRSDPLIIHLPQRVMKFSTPCEREINHAEWQTNEGDATEKSQRHTDGARPL